MGIVKNGVAIDQPQLRCDHGIGKITDRAGPALGSLFQGLVRNDFKRVCLPDNIACAVGILKGIGIPASLVDELVHIVRHGRHTAAKQQADKQCYRKQAVRSFARVFHNGILLVFSFPFFILYNIINFVKYNLSILCILHAKWIYFCSNLPAAEGSGSFDRIF